MKSKKVAAIDIGSNAVRLLISSISEDEEGISFKKILLIRVPLRLGEDSFSVGKITKSRALKLIKLITAFKNLMEVHEVESYRACATAAMREAKNGQKIVEKIKEKTDINIEIIDGGEEAKMIYESHMADRLNVNKNYLYVDVGGGSTEISVIVAGELADSKSFNVGTIRMLRKKVTETELENMNDFLRTVKEKFAPVEIIGSGGNINKLHRLAKLGREDVLNIRELENMYHNLKQLSLEERMEKYELNLDRADVIVPASEIFLHIANISGISDIYVPTFGLVDGIVHKVYINS
ncbi:MAG: ethanolamine ammonia-lyase reactivating factor EutA [Paludibacteraceae bacterium]|nr:ethanolamine ammonia-lyase reactivating factor EutA [Paludibacteraceae bacterium]